MQFERMLYLPSGGLEYPPFVWVKPITFEYMVFLSDPSNYNNEFDQIISLIKKYCILPVDASEIYLKDIYHIYINFLISDILYDREIKREYDQKIYAECTDIKCKHKNTLLIDFGTLNFNQLNIYKNEVSLIFYIDFKYGKDNIHITCRRRKAKDNIEYAYLRLASEPAKLNDIIISFICPQIIHLEINKKAIDKNNYFDFFTYGTINNAINVYNELINREDDFGIQNIVKYICNGCNKINTTTIFNNISISAIRISLAEADSSKSTIHSFLELARLPMFSYSIVNDLDLKYAKRIYEIVQGMKFNTAMIV